MAYDSFVFTHIPKCGGSSFRRFIYESAISSGIDKNKVHIPGEGGVDHNSNIGQLGTTDFNVIKSKEIKILADHSKYVPHIYKALGLEKPFVYTIFRNPKERFISHYNFFYKKVGNGGCKGKEIRDLSDEKLIEIIKSLANIQCAYLLGIEPGYGQRKIIAERFDEIKNILESKIHCFGILEKMSESMELLVHEKPVWLEFKNTIPKINTNSNNKSKVVYGRVNNVFGQYNQFDIKLYNMALKIFEKRYSTDN